MHIARSAIVSSVNLINPKNVSFCEVDTAPKLKAKLADWWHEWAVNRPNLFNGSMIACSSVEQIAEQEIKINWYRTNYAHYLQRSAHPPVAEYARSLYCSVVFLSRSGSLVVGQMSSGTSVPLRHQLPGGNIEQPHDGILSLDHCAIEAAREFEEEIGISIDPRNLRLWRVKVGGDFNDVGLIYAYRTGLADYEIEEAFSRHTLKIKSSGEDPELMKIILEDPTSSSASKLSNAVDYLPTVLNEISHDADLKNEARTVLFHSHGIGSFDFSSLAAADLPQLNELARDRGVYLCPTLFLTEDNFGDTDALLRHFSENRLSKNLDHILGWAIEGPLLGPNGGTPTGSAWRPSAAHWKNLVEWIPLSLRYVVMAPDQFSLDEEVDTGLKFCDLITMIYDAGGRLALGHFAGKSEQASKKRLDEVLAHIERGYEASPYLILTDHLFNDMPRSFKHAFRTEEQRATREEEVAKHSKQSWEANELENLLGLVPAALLTAAREERLTPSLNFDGGHVDLSICRTVVDYLGAKRIIAITDHTESSSLAGEQLNLDSDARLLYREDGVLAASAASQEEQRRNMIKIGMSEQEIEFVFFQVPLAAIEFSPCPKKRTS
jgi:N-acetylglucosamine-6-phosphate deacetylase